MSLFTWTFPFYDVKTHQLFNLLNPAGRSADSKAVLHCIKHFQKEKGQANAH